jgi:hypothetical protein
MIRGIRKTPLVFGKMIIAILRKKISQGGYDNFLGIDNHRGLNDIVYPEEIALKKVVRTH